MQQVKLPRSTLSGRSSSFMQELTMNLTGWTSYGYNMSLTWGDTVYVQVKNALLTYNRSTKTQGDNIRMMGNYDENTRFVQIILLWLRRTRPPRVSDRDRRCFPLGKGIHLRRGWQPDRFCPNE